jgi:MTH538 TIR-like domain (DUF1863)
VSDGGDYPDVKYRAFISYSHIDDAVAKVLHRRLETYRIPTKLVGQAGTRGVIPAKLSPIFRDLDELSAADDLSAEIKNALAQSAALIILCSPSARASRWVNLEIETFRALHGRSRPVLAALVEGEPADAFPESLTAGGAEPVAADLRKGRDGKRLAILKLVAGVAGAPLDALVQRDTQRQMRSVMTITGGAIIAALVMAILSLVAFQAQSEAQRQRQEAEGLVEYMLTDLRDKLKGVGRIDVMTAVNERAMGYYTKQAELGDLPPESLERRARIVHAMGEDDDKRGDLKLATDKFVEAHRTTGAVLARKPDDADAIFAHAQSEYWVGYAAWRASDLTQTRKYWSGYLDQVRALERVEPRTVRTQMELGYAHGNLCDLNMRAYDDPRRAVLLCDASVNYIRKAVAREPANNALKIELANRLGFLADAHVYAGQLDAALRHRLLEADIIDALSANDPKNLDLQDRKIWPQIGIGIVEIANGQIDDGVERLEACHASLVALAKRRPKDQLLLEKQVRVDLRIAQALHKANDASWRKHRDRAIALLDRLSSQKSDLPLARFYNAFNQLEKGVK